MDTSRRNFISVLFGTGIILPATGSVRSFGMLDYLRYTWTSMEVKEILSASPVRNPDISLRKEDSYAILADTRKNSDMLKLNAVAADIWSLCNGANSVNNMVQEITDHFDVEPDAAKRDIILTIMAFKRKGLISLS
ncbi:MAG: PqqD family protein [Syntrophales bacterium]